MGREKKSKVYNLLRIRVLFQSDWSFGLFSASPNLLLCTTQFIQHSQCGLKVRKAVVSRICDLCFLPTLLCSQEEREREREIPLCLHRDRAQVFVSAVGGGMGDKQNDEGWFIYAFVARGTLVLAEFTEFTGNFPAIAVQCLQRLPASNNRYTYACDHHTFNFLLHDGYVYCVVAKESVPKHVSIAFLERVKEDFKKRYGGGKADTASAKSLNKEFGPVIKEHMQYIIEHADEIEKLLKVKAQVSEIKSIMLENIEKVVDRGEKLNDLAEKTTDLHSQAQDFRKQGTKVRRKMWFQNMKIKLVILGILLFLVLIIWVSICQGFNCTKQEDENANMEP